MTVAICIHCGAFKFGAFNPCPKCGSIPETEEDYAVSFVLTDHFSDRSALEEIGRQIAKGIKPYLGPDSLPADMLEMIRAQAKMSKEGCERMATSMEKGTNGDGSPPLT